MTEFFVSLLVFVPLFLFLPLVGKYQDIKHKALEASRYTAWERTVWAADTASWNDGEVNKSDAQLAAEVNSRMFSHPKQGFDSAIINDNPLWVTHGGHSLKPGMASASVLEGATPVAEGQVISQAGYTGISVTKYGGIDRNGLNMSPRSYVESQVTVPVANFIGNYSSASNDTMVMTSTAGILSNSWSAPSQEVMRQRVDNLVVDEAVAVVLRPSRIFSALPYYKEGRNALPVDVAVDSTALPVERLR